MDNERILAKTLAKKVIKDNFWKILVLSLIAFFPSVLGIYTNTWSQSRLEFLLTEFNPSFLFGAAFFIILGSIAVSILMYPILIGVSKAYYNIYLGREVKVSDAFKAYSNSVYTKKAFSLLWTLIKESLKIIIPYFVLPYIVSLMFMFILFPLGIIMLIGSIYFFVIGGIKYSVLLFAFEYIYTSDNLEIDVYEVINNFKIIFKNSKTDVFVFGLSFIGWNILSSLTAIFTLGLSVVLLNAYFSISTILYARINYEKFVKTENSNEV